MKPIPDSVTTPLLQLLGWLGWLVLLICTSRIIWAAALLVVRIHRDESIEGLVGALLGGVIVGSAGLIAAALYAPV
jgi:hypothetical protein